MKLTSALLVLTNTLVAMAQFKAGGPTQPGLPAGCLGSFPNMTQCKANDWFIGEPDPCKPSQIPLPGQQVYIQDAVNFCINMPDPQSLFLQSLFYSQNILPTFVQAEGYVRARCMGSYIAPGAIPLPVGAIRTAHVVRTATYMQIHGKMDCAAMGISCEMSAPGAYDDGGQYDDVGFSHCGKEPYSGVDNSKHPGWPHYVEMGGNSEYCMRVCAAGTQDSGGACDVRLDTAGCTKLMGVQFDAPDGTFVFEDRVAGTTKTFDVPLPEVKTTATTTTTTTTTSAAAIEPVTARPGKDADIASVAPTSAIVATTSKAAPDTTSAKPAPSSANAGNLKNECASKSLSLAVLAAVFFLL
ncbi:hypothetical protein CcCBS67573_g02669 [Chytriomyces confervae]|uniref:Secreted protein n=1 Tax=Chytriomyces confervae TaxID=246404 RepID=A0A507FHY7_9FUNG|nr:hypothetical protein HDU80_007600 [Chytriomyces hyalinus]TPX76051.1 hypothetical protein CcCBS67573_g02669 [Chytriomyces confervae]